MKRQKTREPLPRPLNLRKYFPFGQYPQMTPNQEASLIQIETDDGRSTLEAPTGTGKTAVGFTFLKALGAQGLGPLFYIAPSKAIVHQVGRLHPEVKTVYGRNECDCIFYPEETLKADQIPTIFCSTCKHYVDQASGTVREPGCRACPYYRQKYEAKQAEIVVATMAFYLFTQLFTREWETPAGLVVDEAHKFPHVVRACLSYEITDHNLWRAVAILKDIDPEVSIQLATFARRLISTVKKRSRFKEPLLDDREINSLIEVLEEVDADRIERQLKEALRQGEIDPIDDRETIKQLESIFLNLRRYLHMLHYSVATEGHGALNFTFAYINEEPGPYDKVIYKLVIKAWYVAPLIASILSPRTVALSATIGDPEIFGWETGIRSDVHALGSDFPVTNTRIFLPSDTPNLAVKSRSRQDKTKALRRIAQAAKQFARRGHRSLVVVISNDEREKFMTLSEAEGLHTLSYGNGTTARDVAARFRDGEGDCLVGTMAHYGEGIDLPRQVAPIIFMLRPGYANPHDPATQFEKRRFSPSRYWALQNYRVMQEALQVRGRNVRGPEDLGVTFFISQQFRRFVRAALPQWLEPACVARKTFDECIADTMKLLSD